MLLMSGFETEGLKPPVWVGGEQEALTRLERHLERKAWVASFGRPKMTPQSLLASHTGLSPYLRYLFYYDLINFHYPFICAYKSYQIENAFLSNMCRNT